MPRYKKYLDYDICTSARKLSPGKPSHMWICGFEASHPGSETIKGEFQLIAWSSAEAKTETFKRAQSIIDLRYLAHAPRDG